MMGKKMCGVHKLTWALLVIGGLNWGLVAIGYNVVDMLFGTGSVLARIIYGLVGLSALMMLGVGKCCMKGGMCGCNKESCDHCMPKDGMKPPMAPPMGGQKM